MRYPLLLRATLGKGKSPADPPGQTTRWHTAQAQLVAHAESIAALAVERSPVRSGDRQPSDAWFCWKPGRKQCAQRISARSRWGCGRLDPCGSEFDQQAHPHVLAVLG